METVRQTFKIIKHMQHEVWYKYPEAAKHLPKDIFFITSQELEDMYPDKTPKERENLRSARSTAAVFLMQIGDKLKSGEPHDGRAPDYDDWSVKRRYPVLVRTSAVRSGDLQHGNPRG